MTQSRRQRLLIHVGPHKTGTTTVQSALHQHKDLLIEQGVRYLGSGVRPGLGPRALTGVLDSAAQQRRGLKEWSELQAEAAAATEPRLVLSSEFLCEADDDAARRIVDGWGDVDLQVVVTLRSLARILPSQWQQFVRSGLAEPFGPWVEAIVAAYDDPASPLPFWRRHRHADIVERWARIVGADKVTVVIGDSGDPGLLTREFAALLDLPSDLLVPRSSMENRSLTWEEAAVIRAFNHQATAARHLPTKARLAAWARLKHRTPLSSEHRITIPGSLVDPVRAMCEDTATRIVASGVTVVGDLEELRQVPSADGQQREPQRVPVELAGQVAVEVLTEAARAQRRQRD